MNPCSLSSLVINNNRHSLITNVLLKLCKNRSVKPSSRVFILWAYTMRDELFMVISRIMKHTRSAKPNDMRTFRKIHFHHVYIQAGMFLQRLH